jgi:heptosyltransferase-2
MPTKFLILQTAFLGDVVLATPLIESLRAAYPDATIDFLLRKGNESLLNGHPHLRRILVFDKKNKLHSALALIKALRAERYDLVLNLHRFASSGVLAALSAAREIRGFSKNPLAFAFTRRFPHLLQEGLHEVDRNLSLLEGWIQHPVRRPKLYPPADAAVARPTTPYVCIAPTSVWFTKQWPAEKWSALIHSLPPELSVVLLGGPGDREACNAIIAGSGRSGVWNMAGTLSLLASAAWMQHAVMNYTNDSAPVHLASAVNAPVTAVFCSTIPSFGFGPLSDGARIVEAPSPLPCRPCGLHGRKTCPEGHFRCAMDIQLDPFAPPKID